MGRRKKTLEIFGDYVDRYTLREVRGRRLDGADLL